MTPEPAHRDFLCIRFGGEPSAIWLGDLASFHVDLGVVALPTRAPALLGVAAIRSAVVPIYDLGVACGVARAGATRWIVVLRDGRAGFAFEAYDGHARIAEHAIAASTRPGHVRGEFMLGGQPRSIVDLGSVRAAIERPPHHGGLARDP